MSGQKFPTIDDIKKLAKKDKKRLTKPDPKMLNNLKFISDRGTQRRRLDLKTMKNTVMEPYRTLDLKKKPKKNKRKGK
jgi:hypothetical protein